MLMAPSSKEGGHLEEPIQPQTAAGGTSPDVGTNGQPHPKGVWEREFTSEKGR